MTRTIACAGQQQARSARLAGSAGMLATLPGDCLAAASSFSNDGCRELVFMVPASLSEARTGRGVSPHPQGPKVPYFRPGQYPGRQPRTLPGRSHPVGRPQLTLGRVVTVRRTVTTRLLTS